MKEINTLTYEIIGAAMEAHRAFGPGLLESIYEDALAVELELRGLPFQRQMQVPLKYKGHTIGSDLRVDLFVADKIVVELKSVSQLLPVHEAQILTYLKLTHANVGLLINFNVPVLKHGIKRMLNK